MINTKFEAYKLSREIKRAGTIATVSRPALNEFGEQGDIPLTVGTFSCLFHISQNYIEQYTNDGTIRRNLGQPMVMCLKEDVDLLELEQGDKITLANDSNVNYELVESYDVQNWGIIVDLTLKEVDEGGV